MTDARCLACPGPGIENHHHPRRSAGTITFPPPRNSTHRARYIKVDDPRRQVPVCRRLHTAIGEHRIVLERYRDGLLFTLDGVIEAKDRPDADYLIGSQDGKGKGETILWQSLVPPDNFEDTLAQLMDGTEQAFERYEPLVPYLNPDQIISVYNILYGNTARVRCFLSHQAIREDFGWRRDGKLFTKTDKVRRVAHSFGVSESTIWRDLGEGTVKLIAKCESELSPDQRHGYPRCTCDARRCQWCGEER